jgi:hypothetical protein
VACFASSVLELLLKLFYNALSQPSPTAVDPAIHEGINKYLKKIEGKPAKGVDD